MKIALAGVDYLSKSQIYWGIVENNELNEYSCYNSIDSDFWDIFRHYTGDNYIALMSIYDIWAFNRLSVGLDYHFQLFNWAAKHVKYDHVLYVESDYDSLDEESVAIDQEILNILSFHHTPFHAINNYEQALRIFGV